MNSTMIALGIASIMICIGMVCRGNLRFLQKMLVPVGVISGVLGFIFMNFIVDFININVTVKEFSNIVDVLFTLSFISIGLATTSNKKNSKGSKEPGLVTGGMGMGIIWCLLYTLTAIVGVIVMGIAGKSVNMTSMYGILIPFAFCQGPGQASTYGRIFEQIYGYENAEMVALTFAVIGFMFAFLIGVPVAKYGLKKGLAKNKAKINKAVEKGYFSKTEQRESMGKVTTHSGNIDTLTIHFAVMGLTYILAIIMAKVITFVPLIGESFGGMLFFWGMIAAYLVKFVMRKLKIEYLLDSKLQSRITGWTSDYLVTCSFMAVGIGIIGNWLIPILIVGTICAIVTFIVCLYFGARIGSDHDFERVIGLYGTCTGTTPSGVALVRMVDPKLQTDTASELGMMNMVMIFSTPTMMLITLVGLNTISMPIALGGLLLCVVFYCILLKVFRVWKKPTFTFKSGVQVTSFQDGSSKIQEFIQGFVVEEISDTAGLIK